MMRGWILYKRNALELTTEDHGVRRLLEAAQARGMSLDVYKPEQFDILTESQETASIFIDKKRCPVPDFVIHRIGAESSYFAIAIARHLEQMGVYVCNSSEAIALVKDKMHANQKLKGAGFPTPKTLLVKFPVSLEMIEQELGFPIVIKTMSGARGLGVCLCETVSSLRDVLDLFWVQTSSKEIILQQFIKESYGRDLRVFVVGGRVVGCMKRSSVSSFKANYSLGGAVEAFPVTQEIERLSLDVAALFGLEIAGIDLLFTEPGFTVCEANSSPGFKGMEKATGVDIASQIINYVENKVLDRDKA